MPLKPVQLIKNRWVKHYIAGEVLIGNALAMILGDWMTHVFFLNRAEWLSRKVVGTIYSLDIFYGLFCTVVLSALILWYEKPVRQCLSLFYTDVTPQPDILEKARRRVLNAPYFLVIIDGVIWGVGSFLFLAAGFPGGVRVGLGSGLISVTMAFFWVEHMSQFFRIPLFFPDGNLSGVSGVKTISLKIRFIALFCAVSLVPLAFVHLTIQRYRHVQEVHDFPLEYILHSLESTLMVESGIFMVYAIGLFLFATHHLRRPVQDIIRVMNHAKKGDFTRKVQVYSTDEIGFAGETLNAMNQGLLEREKIKDAFGRYVDPRIRDEILSGRVSLDGERKEATILFADLRHFTPLVAVTPAKDLIHILNSYFDEISHAIESHGGLILQFIGDEVEAVFGAPVARYGHEADAANAALDMRRRLLTLNEKFKEQGLPTISHGIGIHTGPVFAARVGNADRSAYSLIGDTVNMASRIQDLSKTFGTDILVSQTMYDILKDRYDFSEMPEVRVQGKDAPVQVYALKRAVK
ncbi:adenylate/guanylate cyclase domain-containing protein [uncultured Desulfobacter sp.]|uniref:adenylate/guanylate cyclase domain-containing protein n=1 Tax=uncultured Desulfobacter sp. TaxID=240139 RepID=UPI002AAB8327|nr:adenylate/guanylate cyclase domain-containing protein [uncultured Desulfobacter sp.]